jgi:hypothetical protein
MVIELFNPIYHDNKAAAIVVQIGSLNDSSTFWSDTNASVDVYLYRKEQSFSNSTFPRLFR